MIKRHPKWENIINKYFPGSDNLYLNLELIAKPPKKFLEDFFEQLKNHRNYETLKNNFIYDDELDIFIHVHDKISFSEVADLEEEERFFYSFMNKAEIKCIFNIKSASDYLLWLRAEQVEGNMRLNRTFSSLKKKLKQNWSFTNYFDTSLYQEYLQNLNPERLKCCQNIPHGTIHANEVNGMCLKTPFGNIIVLSYALREFLFYMNVFHMGHQFDIEETDTFQAFILAARIMIGKESLDFELDPRGELPSEIKERIDYYTDWQMKFIIGHEYAHHYLNHLDNKTSLKSHSRVFNLNDGFKHYTHKQKNEFEADLHAIMETTYDDLEKDELINGAFLFFLYLDMYYKVEDYLFPKISYPFTHPQPLDRIRELRKSIHDDIGASEQVLRDLISNYDDFMQYFLEEFLPFNVDVIETQGSVYIPSYKKEKLIDRLDF